MRYVGTDNEQHLRVRQWDEPCTQALPHIWNAKKEQLNNRTAQLLSRPP